MFKKEPTIPLAFYEEQVQLWSLERAELLNRIQHPTIYSPADTVVRSADHAPIAVTQQPSTAFSEEEERELALVGTVVLGSEEGGENAPAPKE
jgi:hypothetical protein